MKNLIKMKEPVGITQHIAAVIGMEGSAFCKSVGEAATGDYHYHRPVSTHPVCGASSSSTTQHRTGSGVDKGAQNSGHQWPQQKYIDAELDEMRRDQIFFKCKEPYSKTYICPNKELRVLTVINVYEVKILDEPTDN